MWQRQPPGKALEALNKRTFGEQRKDAVVIHPEVVKMSLTEYAELLRSQGASEKMVEQEVVALQELQERYNEAAPSVADRRKSRKERPVSDALAEYTESAQRVRRNRQKERTDHGDEETP